MNRAQARVQKTATSSGWVGYFQGSPITIHVVSNTAAEPGPSIQTTETSALRTQPRMPDAHKVQRSMARSGDPDQHSLHSVHCHIIIQNGTDRQTAIVQCPRHSQTDTLLRQHNTPATARYLLLPLIGRIHGAIVAATGRSDRRGDDRPVYTPYKLHAQLKDC